MGNLLNVQRPAGVGAPGFTPTASQPGSFPLAPQVAQQLGVTQTPDAQSFLQKYGTQGPQAILPVTQPAAPQIAQPVIPKMVTDPVNKSVMPPSINLEPISNNSDPSPVSIPQVKKRVNLQKDNLAPAHYNIASKYLGSGEVSHNKVLGKFFQESMGQKINPQKTAWCAAFANSALKASGQKGTGSLMARSFLKYGSPTDAPQKGDIAVFSRGKDPRFGHVGFYAGESKRNGQRFIKVLGGNQDNKVSIKEYPASRLVGFRTPPAAEEVASKGLPKEKAPYRPIFVPKQFVNNMSFMQKYQMKKVFDQYVKPYGQFERVKGGYNLNIEKMPPKVKNSLIHKLQGSSRLNSQQKSYMLKLLGR